MKDIYGKTALHIGSNKSPDLIRFLISNGADVNLKDNDGQTFLHQIYSPSNLAAIWGVLLTHAVDINAKDKKGCTPLHYAVIRGLVKLVKFLVSHGVDVNSKDFLGSTPLHYAAEQFSFDIVEVLISNGANINEKNNKNQTALSLAIESPPEYKIYYNKTIELLKSNGGIC
ncbi:ankyrin repeat protein, putative [Trichomonas vaginalis G3]|uniref:Ankyrin repeat protein, putative n=1 Tax=Trichomonas vaginalis (strain ATCC PRA-98 / G3) TaxID=412133 RepID=A2G1K2_TRIV3|nr:spectrin binding [Trichomonas vaginalis G3]EAX88960.1 ankyrin repeat protein, putative [Trichomonas vaginalis G3]KAI5484908.1 spectrin binding [Trichomonas vaginalis G3]|eukprot:XP_001301890.1 ankyrin repeat protein [Trichomonas vaginalis G3]